MNITTQIMFKTLAAVFVLIASLLTIVTVLGGMKSEQLVDALLKVGLVFVILFVTAYVLSILQTAGTGKKKR